MSECPAPELLSGLLSASLAAEEEAKLRAHLADCPSCRAELDRATEDPDLTRWALWANAPSPYQDEPALAQLVNHLARSSDDCRVPAVAPGAALGLGAPRVEGDLGTLGPYRILGEIGRGGLGIVLHGHDETLGRPVAIKLLHPDRIVGDTYRQLAREARHAARFRHDNVVVVHAVEETAAGLPFIVMEYIPGPSVAELLREQTRLAPRQAAELIAQAADGLAAAHDAGLIHRDIKPANLLLDPATKRTRIVDFGLARVADAPGSIPEGTVIGTPSYMSPEQAQGRDAVDARTDQYSLGASLYEILTGEPPFRGTPARVVHQVLEDEPRPPRQLNEAIPRDLETICLTTLAKDPARRYPTTALLAEDLRRWLRGEPILARPVGPAGRLVRWAQRNRRVASLAATSLLLLAAIVVGTVIAAVRIDHSRRLAVSAQRRADRNAAEATAAARLAADQARIANEQRTLALETVSTLIKEVQDDLGHSAGTLALRQRLADTAIARLERIADSPSGNADVALAQALAHERIGELAFLAGRTEQARKHFAAARDRAAALAVGSSTAGGEPQLLQALALDKLGDLALYSQNLAAAETAYREALALRAAMPDADRESPEGKRGRAVSENKLGDLALRSGRLTEARAAFERGLTLTEGDQDPDPQRHRFDLRFVQTRLGDVALACCDYEGAQRAYLEARRHAEEERKTAPNDPKAQREVAVCDSKLGGVALRRADPRGALRYYRQYLAASESLAKANPNNAESRRDLLTAMSLVGDALSAAGETSTADQTLRESLRLAEALSAADPRSAQKRADIYLILNKLADLANRRGRFDEAVRWLEQAITKHRESAEAGLITAAVRAMLDAQRASELAVCRGAERALAEPGWISKQPTELARGLWGIRALTLARRGETRSAAESAETLRRLAPKDPESLAIIARVYALCVRVVTSSRDATRDGSLRDQYAAHAVGALREAARLQPTLLDGRGFEPDLDPLWDFPQFRNLLEESSGRK